MEIKTFKSSSRKKILILSSKGGYGHTAASIAIQEILAPRFQFSIEYPIEEVNRFGIQSGENLYNLLLKKEWIRTTNFLSNQLAPLLFQLKTFQIESVIEAHLLREKPDLVISLIPFVNYPASEAARKLDIPFLLLTTDNDLTNWVLGLHRIKHPFFRVTIGRDHAKTRGLLIKNRIKDSMIDTIGLPIRPAFFKEKDPRQIKEEFSIPLDKPVVCLMMGGAGGCGAYNYAEQLMKLQMPFHIVACTGNNHHLYHKLQQLSKSDSLVSLSVLGFTDQVASLMQISDLLITKPGPGTINEAMARKLPILIDNAHVTLAWEKVNQEIVIRERIGQLVNDVSEIHTLVPKYLQDSLFKEKIQSSYDRIELPHFANNLEKSIEMLFDISAKTRLVQFS